MHICPKKNKTSLTFLSQILSSIDKTKQYFIDYLNTGDRNYWEDMISSKHFHFGYYQIMDKKLIPKKYFYQLKKIIDKHHSLCLAIDDKKEEAFTLLAFFHQQTKKFFFSELRRFNLDKEELLKLNLKELENKIIEITEYEKESDPETFIKDFEEHLKLKE